MYTKVLRNSLMTDLVTQITGFRKEQIRAVQQNVTPMTQTQEKDVPVKIMVPEIQLIKLQKCLPQLNSSQNINNIRSPVKSPTNAKNQKVKIINPVLISSSQKQKQRQTHSPPKRMNFSLKSPIKNTQQFLTKETPERAQIQNKVVQSSKNRAQSQIKNFLSQTCTGNSAKKFKSRNLSIIGLESNTLSQTFVESEVDLNSSFNKSSYLNGLQTKYKTNKKSGQSAAKENKKNQFSKYLTNNKGGNYQGLIAHSQKSTQLTEPGNQTFIDKILEQTRSNSKQRNSSMNRQLKSNDVIQNFRQNKINLEKNLQELLTQKQPKSPKQNTLKNMKSPAKNNKNQNNNENQITKSASKDLKQLLNQSQIVAQTKQIKSPAKQLGRSPNRVNLGRQPMDKKQKQQTLVLTEKRIETNVARNVRPSDIVKDSYQSLKSFLKEINEISTDNESESAAINLEIKIEQPQVQEQEYQQANLNNTYGTLWILDELMEKRFELQQTKNEVLADS
ncbi:UNKNOWN [Stylonychia lemnae]|uniref:Uncharacterized protein n=1 Tax=Stylonychia lemnae TaxID=5949 RepID=A0A078BC39_STYLE|nr:UNKNOWN [Stylonychia lemnae]|eukprot:CDW91163.1 UNKNOWN [Stylonychia lemnae]